MLRPTVDNIGLLRLRRSEMSFLTRIRSPEFAMQGHTLADRSQALVFSTPSPMACIALYHGGGNDRLFGFWRLVDTLLGANFAVVTVDLPGHGAGAGDCFSLEAARHRLDALIQLAASIVAPEHVVVLGQSMGGAFALDLLTRTAAAPPTIAVSVPLRLELAVQVLRELASVADPEVWNVLRYVSAADAWPAFGPFGRRRFPIRLPTREPYITAFQRTLADLDLTRRLTAAPRSRGVLLVHGKRDGIAPFIHALELADVFGEGASVLTVPNGNHFDMLLRRNVIEDIIKWTQWRVTQASGGPIADIGP